jgi:cytochrome c biogenesis protein CcmG/thiol:disulfide interchange protein DsbE
MRRWKWILWPLAGLPVVGLLAYGLTRDPTTIPSPLPGRPAPEFRLETLAGDTLALSDLRGHVVLVNFWSSWCLACVDEHPVLVEAAERYGDRGLRVVGVVYQDARENAVRWMQRMGGEWPSVLDPGARTAIDYGVYGVPETFFIDRDGRVAYKQIGPVNREIVRTWVERLLAGEGAPAGELPAVGRSEGYVPIFSDTARAPARPAVPR